jgi:ABC-type glutathione transport system ATPase component
MNQLTQEPLVAIHDVSKSYRRGSQRVPVLEHITLGITEGEFLDLMGPSGSGKSCCQVYGFSGCCNEFIRRRTSFNSR